MWRWQSIFKRTLFVGSWISYTRKDKGSGPAIWSFLYRRGDLGIAPENGVITGKNG